MFKKSNTILDKICADKIAEIILRKKEEPIKALQKKINNSKFYRKSFINALKKSGASLIAEIKKSAPANIGTPLRHNFNPVAIAKIYEAHGASAISVITNEKYFMGSINNLLAVKKNSRLPILQKEFIIDPYQIYEAKAYGADAILLIAAILDDDQLKNLYNLAGRLNLDILLEAHDEKELSRVLNISPKIIGINNRNLKKMEINLDNFVNLAKNIPPSIIKVAESGIYTREDIKKMKSAGADAILVGASLIKAENIGDAVEKLIRNN